MSSRIRPITRIAVAAVLSVSAPSWTASGQPVAEGDRDGRLPTFERLALETTPADTAAAALRPLLGEGFRVVPDARTNALLVSAPDEAALARLRAIVVALDGAGSAPPAAPQAIGDDGSVSVQVSIVGVGLSALADRGIALAAPGRKGLSDAAALAVAKLVDAGVESGVTLHAHVATSLPLGKPKRFSRGTSYPTKSVSVSPGAPATAGFGGYVSAANDLSLLARPGEGGATWIDVSYEVAQPLSSDGGEPPVKVSMSGSYEVALRPGEVGVAGGRLGSDLEAAFVFVVV